MGRIKRSRMHKNKKEINRQNNKMCNRTKDIDQIHEDMKEENAVKLSKQEIDADKPGLGQFYCIPCSKYFVSMTVLDEHKKGKPHRRRMKNLQDVPYSHEEAERAAGMGGTDKGVITRKEEAEKQAVQETVQAAMTIDA